MAAIDLSGATSYPLIYTQASIATTWQEFVLPTWANRVTVTFEAAAGYVAFIQTGIGSPETPADGGAVGTHRQPMAADTSYQMEVGRDPRTDSALEGETARASVFLAAQTGTVTATLYIGKE